MGGFALLLAAFSGFSCSSSGGSGQASEDIPSVRNYMVFNIGNNNFFDLTINDDDSTLNFNDLSANMSGSIPFTEENGLMQSSNPEFSSLYESPLVGLVINSTEGLSLATYAEPITLSDMNNKNFLMMQFRNAQGGNGFEVGCGSVDGNGMMTSTDYGPGSPSEPYSSATDSFGELPSVDHGNYLSFEFSDEGTTQTGYIFGGPEFYVIGIPNGPNFMFTQQAGSAFNPDWAGNYHLMLYQKENAYMVDGQEEAGDIQFGTYRVGLSADGVLTISNNQGESEEHALIPMAQSPYWGPGKIDQACNGMFTYSSEGTEVFIAFIDKIFLIASYTANSDGSGKYDYSYGMGTLSQ